MSEQTKAKKTPKKLGGKKEEQQQPTPDQTEGEEKGEEAEGGADAEADAGAQGGADADGEEEEPQQCARDQIVERGGQGRSPWVRAGAALAHSASWAWRKAIVRSQASSAACLS